MPVNHPEEMSIMAKSKTKSAKKRVKVQDLPTAGKKLTEKEMKRVKGGLVTEVSLPLDSIKSDAGMETLKLDRKNLKF